MLAPYAPHLAEELWERAGHRESLARSTWPAFDEALCVDDTKEIVVQVNGKIRGRFEAPAGSAEDFLQATALAKVAEWTQGRRIAKVVVVRDKLVNIVAVGS
jgi:leucyl-tRNA synthetase